MAGLAAQGYDPQDVQAWLGRRKDQAPRSWLRDQKTADPYDVAQAFWELQRGLQLRSRSMSVGAIKAMTTKGGTRRIGFGLRGLEVLGYDSKEVHEWLLGRTNLKAVPLTKQASSERANADAHGLAQHLQHPDREAVKRALAAFLKEGGQKRIERALSQLEAMGYSGLELHSWLDGKSQSPPSQRMASKTTSSGNLSFQATHKQDAHSSGTRSEKEAPAQVRLPTAEGAPAKLPIKDASRNIEARSGEATPTLATHDAGNTMTLATRDAKEIGHYVESSDRRGLQRFFKSLLGHGGRSEIEKALAGLHEIGYDPAAVHMWLAKGGAVPHWSNPKADPLNAPVSPSDNSKKTLAGVDGQRAQSTPQTNHPGSENGSPAQVKLPVAEGAPAKLPIKDASKNVEVRSQEKTPPSATHDAGNINHDNRNSVAHSSGDTMALAMRDAKEIGHYVESSDRRGLQRFFKSLLGHGGRSEIEKALAGLREVGYDPAAVHAWLAKGGAVPVKESPTAATHDAEQIQQYIKNSDRPGLQRFLKSFLSHGGRARLEKALEGVKKLGYDPASLHTWLAKGGEVLHVSTPKRNSRDDATSTSHTSKNIPVSAGRTLKNAPTKHNDFASNNRSPEKSQAVGPVSARVELVKTAAPRATKKMDAPSHKAKPNSGEETHTEQHMKLEYRQFTKGDSVHVVGPVQVGPVEVKDAELAEPRDKPNALSDKPKITITKTTKSVRRPAQAKETPQREEQVPLDKSSYIGSNRLMDVNVVRVNHYQVSVKPKKENDHAAARGAKETAPRHTKVNDFEKREVRLKVRKINDMKRPPAKQPK